ncbi:MAG: OmpA family protein [Oleiphilaceae bacterium]|nr:OmpA family protein [Oleiphilaceae bacterium]
MHTFNKLRRSALMLALGAGMAWTAPTLADSTDTVHLGKQTVSKEQVIDLLAPKPQQPKLLTRGLRLHKDDAEPAFQGDQVPAAKSLSLEVYFELNSAQLSPEAVAQLTPVGEALQSNELATLNFTLEGHTDASGDEQYNLKLSEARARAVKAFFVENFQLSPERVKTEGKGESQLIEGTPPTSGIHRRVTIVAY